MSYRADGAPEEPPRERVLRALRAWSAFPASQEPRPLVLLGPAVMPGGFPDGTAKTAVNHGAVDAVPGFPADILGVLRARRQDHDGHRLLMTTAIRGGAVFATDRGRQQLAAWEVRAHGVPAPIMVLDPAAARQAWWPPHGERREWRGSTAVLAGAGHILTMQFSGIPFGMPATRMRRYWKPELRWLSSPARWTSAHRGGDSCTRSSARLPPGWTILSARGSCSTSTPRS